MKELSIEQKAKRYDGVIEQLRTMMPNWESLSYNGKTFLQDLVHIIPELKESEDEKIRKDLIQLTYKVYANTDYLTCFEQEKMLAWLEKQGEQKPNFCHHEVDFSNCSEEYIKAYYDGWNNCNQQHSQLKAEQNPAWSEEDERNLQGIIVEIEANKNQAPDYDIETYDRFLNWLKSLRPQNRWKPSELQLETLKLVAEKDGTCLMELYEQLKKL